MTGKQWLAWAFESVTGWRPYVSMSRASGEVYMHRWQLLKTRLLSVYLHKICLPDEDPWYHTHPWRKSWSVKLWNSYRETVQIVFRGLRESVLYNYTRLPGFVSRIPERHRIIELKDGKPVWTLFIGWRSDAPWGFIDPDTDSVVDWKTRSKQRGLPLTAFSGGQNS